MDKTLKRKWIKVLERREAKNKQMLKNNEITSDVYILLNSILHDKYNEICSGK